MGSRIQRLFFNFNLKNSNSVKYITVNENFRVYIKELGWDTEIVIMAKRLEISARGSGGNIPSKRVYYTLDDLHRLSIQCLKDEISHISHESGCSEIVLTHCPRGRYHPTHLLNSPHITFFRGQMNVYLNVMFGVTRIKIFYDPRATEMSENSHDIFKDFIFNFEYVTKKGRVLRRINYSEESEDLSL